MTDSDHEADTDLLRKLKLGSKEAANKLIVRYFDRVVVAASRRIGGRRLHAVDSEDIAASVFESIWKKADQNKFDDGGITNADEFWRLLCKMIQFKAEDHARREHAQKRGGGMIRGESAFKGSRDSSFAGVESFADSEFSPYEILAFKEQHARLWEALHDQDLKEIVTLRMEDRTISEIATHFNKSQSWVKRKLALIRDIWRNEMDESTHK